MIPVIRDDNKFGFSLQDQLFLLNYQNYNVGK